MSEVNQETSQLTLDDLQKKLSRRVSTYNAKLLMQSAIKQSGINSQEPLNNEDAKSICLELIKKGGPAFQVGKDVYRKLQ